MRKLGRLRHVAAGLRDAFISRNNDLQGDWALGPLYAHADAATKTVVLHLLDGRAMPPSLPADAVARKYTAYVRHALEKLGLADGDVVRAEVALAFDVVPDMPLQRSGALGQPFLLTVTLALGDGRQASYRRYGFCLPNPPFVFSKRFGY